MELHADDQALVLSLSLLAIVGCQNKEAPAAATDAPAPEAAATQRAEAAPATGPEITPANPPAEPAAAVLDAQPGPKGTTWELTKVATVGQIMTVQFNVQPQAGGTIFITGLPIDDVAVIDDATSQRYGVLKDDNGRPLASPLQSEGKTLRLDSSKSGQSVVVWLKFPALPADSKTISITIPEVAPFDGIQVIR